MTFEAFMESAWNDHAERPEDVASRLATSLSLIASPADVAPYARLAVHVYGEHLARWSDGAALLASIRALPACSGDATAAVERGIATLRIGIGEAAALDGLGHDDRIAALATASCAFTGQGRFDDAIAALEEAARLARGDVAPDSFAVRALAVAGNNLAAALETKRDRDARETRAMIDAARAGLRYWKLVGTWLEHERAEYRLARTHLAARDARHAIDAARRCIDVCERNDAPAFERFFGHVVLAVALRAAGEAAAHEAARMRAIDLYKRVAPDERRWCEAELAELGTTGAQPV